MGELTFDTLKEQLEGASSTLLGMAEKASWNKISKNCLYILAEEEFPDQRDLEGRNIRKLRNEKKEPKPLTALMPVLLEKYYTIYEIDLFVYKSTQHLTIIEIYYRLKDQMEPDYEKTIEQASPMLHCKVSIPPYAHDFSPYTGAAKFKKSDINWELGTFNHRRNTFWLRIKFRWYLLKRALARR
jgi:hypothetical protein